MRLALLALVAACAPDRGPRWRPAGQPGPRDGGTLRFAVKDPVRTLDPSIAYDEVSSMPVHALFDTLVDYEPAGTGLVPRLAEHWEVSSDGLVYTFVLRDGARFSDGTPVTAADFAYSLERALATPDSPFGPMLAGIAGASDVMAGKAAHATGIVAVAPHTLELRLVHPDAALLYVLTMSFTTPQRAAHVAAAGDQLRREPLGCGPYVLERWDEGERLVLRRNPSYWDPARVHLDALDLRENVARDVQFLMFERGELDAAERLAAPDYLWLLDRADWQPYVHRLVMLDAFGSRMNVRQRPFDDRRVRQALNYAVNKADVITLLNGRGVEAHGIVPPNMPGYHVDLAGYPYDPTKARALLEEAGLRAGFATEIWTQGTDTDLKIAQKMQQDLAKVGVQLAIKSVAWASFLDAIRQPKTVPVFDLGWSADFPDPSNFLDVPFHTGGANNHPFYSNAAVHRLLE